MLESVTNRRRYFTGLSKPWPEALIGDGDGRPAGRTSDGDSGGASGRLPPGGIPDGEKRCVPTSCPSPRADPSGFTSMLLFLMRGILRSTLTTSPHLAEPTFPASSIASTFI